ncbi:anoctamin-8 [Platysternon megacephalum]|uniref:Anoctamin-8 n=1 Tax=Platysternon megacephalum TaxID=55544 RepID=A0A4D9EHC4_9SAUR|nr:anoctamin-8 [Platysternon megacephalum]
MLIQMDQLFVESKETEGKGLYCGPLVHPENLDCVISCESQACKGPKLPEEEDLVLATCPHMNGALKHAGPAGRGDFSKRKPVFQGGAGSDVIELSVPSTGNEERDHGFPLPATELGATVLVTTKTIQNNCTTEERP